MCLSPTKNPHCLSADHSAVDRLSVGVIGLGLIGGSLAKALACRAGAKVTGLDCDDAVIQQALADGILTAGGVLNQSEDMLRADSDDQAEVWGLLKSCAIVFICTPVE